ncbi:hypothetical protein J5491_02260 [Candidatus Saccharibacteria bacterium]|nr:hypothetical protein [Candidatus Saccharibacteria bacterium]
MYVISGLVDFIREAPGNIALLILISWLIWPGMMFLVGWVGESRLIPVGEHQSMAFLPGDLSLGVMAIELLRLHERTYDNPNWWGYDPAFWMFVTMAVAMVVLAFVIEADQKNYPPRASLSPTKITHDVVGYWLIPTLLFGLGLPQLVDGIRFGIGGSWPIWLEFTMALSFYIACVVNDCLKGATEEDIAIRHPANWQPIWRQAE